LLLLDSHPTVCPVSHPSVMVPSLPLQGVVVEEEEEEEEELLL
jgi:hypothetical protein